nr:hypothetical protein [Bacilli bacterium]
IKPMRKIRLLNNIAFVVAFLASCSFGGGESGSSLDTQAASLTPSGFEPSQSFVSDIGHSIRKYSEKETSEQASSSKMRSLPLGFLSSLNNKKQYKVSIYQSNWISSEKKYGNPWHDFDVTVEGGKPLYADVEEREALERQCRPIYSAAGGVYSLEGFYADEACTRFINYEYFVVNSDLNVYYYCEG